ncbi:MAG: ATP-binding protein [Dehalococcoidia bacterium]
MSDRLEPIALMGNPVVRAMLDAGGISLWDADLVSETTVYQDGFWERYGYSPDKLTETFDFLGVVHSRDKRALARAWRQHVEGETESYEAQWRLRTASGDWRWIQSRGKVVERDAMGNATRMVGAYTDITELKQSELDLKESSAELDAVFRSSRDGLAVVSVSLELLHVNEAAMELLEKFLGRGVSIGESVRLLPSTSPDRPVLADINLVLSGKADVPSRVIEGARGAGWLEFSYSPVFDEDGLILGAAITLRDITEKTRLEQSRVQALRLESMGLMAGGIAHDFNNLLAAIVGNIELAQLTAENPDARESLDDARQAAQRASELVQQLLAFAGRHDPIVKPIDLSALAAEIVRYAGKIPGKRVPILDDLPSGLPEIDGDATQIRQLVLNLLVNALDATRESGTSVQIRTWMVGSPREVTADLLFPERPASQFVALQVSDDGPGMDLETRTHVFDPFFTTKDAGHGLGLASVLGTVRAHGGTISLQSEPGAGATFTVFLPAC